MRLVLTEFLGNSLNVWEWLFIVNNIFTFLCSDFLAKVEKEFYCVGSMKELAEPLRSDSGKDGYKHVLDGMVGNVA